MNKSISAGGIIINDKNEVALTCHKGGRNWNFPKGRVEQNENIENAAIREVYEETGIKDAKLVKLLGKYHRYAISADGVTENKLDFKTIYIYLFKSNQVDLKPVDSQNPQAKWFTKDKIFDVLKHPKDKEFFRKIIDKL